MYLDVHSSAEVIPFFRTPSLSNYITTTHHPQLKMNDRVGTLYNNILPLQSIYKKR